MRKKNFTLRSMYIISKKRNNNCSHKHHANKLRNSILHQEYSRRDDKLKFDEGFSLNIPEWYLFSLCVTRLCVRLVRCWWCWCCEVGCLLFEAEGGAAAKYIQHTRYWFGIFNKTQYILWLRWWWRYARLPSYEQ